MREKSYLTGLFIIIIFMITFFVLGLSNAAKLVSNIIFDKEFAPFFIWGNEV